MKNLIFKIVMSCVVFVPAAAFAKIPLEGSYNLKLDSSRGGCSNHDCVGPCKSSVLIQRRGKGDKGTLIAHAIHRDGSYYPLGAFVVPRTGEQLHINTLVSGTQFVREKYFVDEFGEYTNLFFEAQISLNKKGELVVLKNEKRNKKAPFLQTTLYCEYERIK